MSPVSANDKQHYYDRYWEQQDHRRVAQRAEWRGRRLHSLVGFRYNSMLDIGAGQGEMMMYFKNAGYRVEGWDISPEAVRQLKESGYSARVVDLERDEFEGHYSLIVCCEVLQQIEDPVAVLRKADRVLLPNGRMAISVPNEFHIVRRLGIGRPLVEHVQLFSPRKARELATLAGYVIEAESFQPLVPPRWGRLAGKLGQWLANFMPSLFCISAMLILRRKHDN